MSGDIRESVPTPDGESGNRFDALASNVAHDSKRLLRYEFRDPISWRNCTLVVNGDAPAFDGLTVEHPDCDGHADVSVDLDAFYCRACGWNGRVSGAWAFDMWRRLQ